MTNYISTPLSTLNADLNAIQTTLSSKADKSEIPEVPEDLSSFTNSPGYATSAYVQEYVAEHGGGGGGDFLPLSGGNLSGRIYLKTTTGGQTIDTSMVVGYYSDDICNAEISVYASEEDLRSGNGGGPVNCYAKVYDKANDVSSDVSIDILPSMTQDPDTEEDVYVDGTWGGELEDGGTWSISLDANPSATGNPLAANISWIDDDEDAFAEAYGFPLSNPTADTTVETTTPFVTSADVDAVIGDINSILDSINGQTI